MSTDEIVAGYLDELATELDLRGASTAAVDDVLRQVESHLLEAGVDPRSEFGSPADCARSFLPGHSMTRFWILVAVSVVSTVIGGLLAIRGVFGVLEDQLVFGILPGWWSIGVGLLLVGSWVLLLINESRRRR